MERVLETLEKYTIWTTVFLIPLAVLPVFPNYFTTVKIIILVTGVLVCLLIKLARAISEGRIEFSVSNFDFPLFLLLLAYLVSGMIRSPNKMEAFFLPGTATIVIFGVILFFLINQLEQKDKKSLLTTIFLSGVLVSVFNLLAVSGILAKIPRIPQFMTEPTFTTLGATLQSTIFLISLFPLGLELLISEKEAVKKLFFGVTCTIFSLGALANIYNLLPGKPSYPKFANWGTYWEVAVDSLKQSPIFGVGPGNFLTSFNRYRPLSYNLTDLWPLRFTMARSFYLNLLTETGFLGLAALALIIFNVYRFFSKDVKEKNLAGWETLGDFKMLSLGILLIAMAVFPGTIDLTVLLFIFLALNATTKKITLNLFSQVSQGLAETSGLAPKIPAIFASFPVLAGIMVFGFFGIKTVSAEYTYKKSLDALSRNDGKATFDLMAKAINKNRRVDRYHLSFSQVNFALADNLAQKKDLTEEERTTVSQLIQQAIAEGKAGVSLNITRAENWANLSRLYRSIMAFAQGADQFTIQTYNQAISLDPINPEYRLNLGGTYYALGDYENAIDALKLAAAAKPNHANVRYNLAISYRDKGDIEKAINEMTLVLSLVQKDSQDYETAKKELENLESKRPKKEAGEGENLTPPKPAEKPVIKPPIELPEEAQPPASPELQQGEPAGPVESSPSPTPSS